MVGRSRCFLMLCGLVILPSIVIADCPAEPLEWVNLFDGKSLDGWEGNRTLWSAKDGVIVGDSPGIRQNEFLATRGRYKDFEFWFEFRLREGQGNSGVQFRSEREPNSSAMVGYQADIGQQYWGCLYDEHRRRRILAQAPAELTQHLKKKDWNAYRIRAEGDRIRLWINGFKTVDYREPEAGIPREGVIALQIHSGPAMRIEFRKLQLRNLSDDS